MRVKLGARLSARTVMLLFALLNLSPPAAAYIDPGTGGLVLGSTWGFLASAAGAVGAFVLFRLIKPLKNRIRKLVRRT